MTSAHRHDRAERRYDEADRGMRGGWGKPRPVVGVHFQRGPVPSPALNESRLNLHSSVRCFCDGASNGQVAHEPIRSTLFQWKVVVSVGCRSWWG
jgi:hypothetical protein